MQMMYEKNGIILKVLREKSAPQVLEFLTRNRDFFDKYEISKQDNYYTTAFQKKTLQAEAAALLQGTAIRFYCFTAKNPDEIIGTVSFQNIRRGGFMSCQIGYKIDKAHTRQGLGRKCVSLALDAITRDYEIHRVEAYIMPDNIASIELAKSVGFVPEGIAYDFAKINNNWENHLRYIYISAYQ